MSVLTQPAPTAAPEFGEEPPSGGSGNRRTLLLVGGLVAALAAAAAAYFFLFSGSGSDTAAAPNPTQPKAAAPKSSPSAAPSAAASKPPTSSYQVTKRDPFAPLPSAGSGSTTTTTTTTTTKSAGAPKPAAPIAAPITLILASVDAKAGSATLSVDGTSYSAAVGKVFGKNYMLYAVFNATCAGVLVGDQSVPLCIGHSVSVTP